MILMTVALELPDSVSVGVTFTPQDIAREWTGILVGGYSHGDKIPLYGKHKEIFHCGKYEYSGIITREGHLLYFHVRK